MKKTISLILLISIIISLLSGCSLLQSVNNNLQKPLPDVQEVALKNLPQSFKTSFQGEEVTATFKWEEDSCTVTVPLYEEEATIVFNYDKSTKTLSASVSQGEETVKITYDDNGYISKLYVADIGETSVTYADDYKSFTWNVGENGTADGTVSEKSVIFDVQTGNDYSHKYEIEFNESFIASLKNEGSTNIPTYATATDEKGNITKITATINEESTDFAFTLSEKIKTDAWQDVVTLMMVQALQNIAESATCMCLITLPYIQ